MVDERVDKYNKILILSPLILSLSKDEGCGHPANPG